MIGNLLRSKVSTKRNRPSSSLSKQRKYTKPSPTLGRNADKNNYDAWRDIYQEGLFDTHSNNRYIKSNKTSLSSEQFSKHHTAEYEKTQPNSYKGK